MIIYLLALFAIILISLGNHFLGDWKRHNRTLQNTISTIVIFIVIAVCIHVTTLNVSYKSYIDMKELGDACLPPRIEMINIYDDYATTKMSNQSMFFSTEYQGYQENVSKFIENLGIVVIKHNRILVSKRIMKANWLFSWLIVAPDDNMVLLNMENMP